MGNFELYTQQRLPLDTDKSGNGYSYLFSQSVFGTPAGLHDKACR